MPKLPVVSANKLIKALKQIGFSKNRSRGSHLIMKHSDGRRTVIPIHTKGNIPNGTLMAILKDLGISKDDLIKLL